MVRDMAHRYALRGTSATAEELEAEIRYELARRFKDFDPSRGVRWSTYAHNLARGACLHYLRDHAHMIRIPAWLREEGVKPSNVRSLDAVTEDGDDAILDNIAYEDGVDLDLRIDVRRSIAKLSALQRTCLTLTYYEGFSRTDIARTLGFSVKYISYIMKRAEGRLRRTLCESYAREGIIHAE